MSATISFECWGDIIASIYESALYPDTWGDALVKIGETVNCHTGHLICVGDNLEFSLYHTSDGPNTEAVRDFDETVHMGLHPRVSYAKGQPSMTLLRDYMHTSEAEMDKDYFYSQVAPRHDVSYYGGVILQQSPGQFTAFGVFRGKRAGHLTKEECDALGLIAPHIKRGVELMRLNRLSILTGASPGDLDRYSQPVIVLNRAGEITGLNHEARDIIHRRDGIFERNRRMVLVDRRAMKSLNESIRTILSAEFHSSPTECYIKAERNGQARPYLIMVSPLTSDIDKVSGFACMVTIVDQNNDKNDLKEPLTRLYGLTPAEAEIAEAVVPGKTLKQIAEEKSVSLETPRFHLKNVFSKTGVRRQSDLIRLVSRLSCRR